MASKKFEKGSEEFNFFAEFYKFVQKYYIPEPAEDYWAKMMEDARQLSKKYRGGFYTTMLLAFIDYAGDRKDE